ncbi:MAG TPA: MFS transporter [Burkholderiales bacterium]|nr:MFS transporter [Burkholderiales bacterium]
MAVSARSAAAYSPFRVRSFRFQWPADLCASFGFEMETIILGWYVLVETQSVLMLSVFGALQYLGTLFAPMSGILGHRIGNKRVICAMRGCYALLASTVMTLALTGVLMPVHVFIFGTLLGLFRPSDLVMRYSLIGQTIPSENLLGATSISRTTQDGARVMGALSGAGLSAALGIGYAYMAIAALYATSLLLSLNVAGRSVAGAGTGTRADTSAAAGRNTSPWRDLLDVLDYVWNTPRLLAAMWIAFLVNVSAFPFMTSLMPYVAKEIYHTGQAGVGYLVASFAGGALLGSIALSRYGGYIRPGRMILAFCAVWYLLVLVFVQMPGPGSGSIALMLCGLAQSLCLVPLSAMLLRTSDERYRGGVMGVRQLMIYGVPIGLLAAGPTIAHFGFPMTATLYGVFSLAVTALIAAKWRSALWRLNAPANAR